MKFLAIAAVALIGIGWGGNTRADPMDHGHPAADIQLHNEFYSKWKRKDTGGGCCNNQDCYPTSARYDPKLNQWWARRREDGKWLLIPKAVYDPNDPKDAVIASPDGRPHLCAPIPAYEKSYSGGVICFKPGAAI